MTKVVKDEPTFESLMSRIEELTEKLENPDTNIEQSLGLYEEAMKLVGTAQSRLAEIQHKFEVIQKGNQPKSKADSPDVLMTVDDTSGLLDEKLEETDDNQNVQKTLL